MNFETVQIHFFSEFLVCCRPEILPPWQRGPNDLFLLTNQGAARFYLLYHDKTPLRTSASPPAFCLSVNFHILLVLSTLY